MKNADTRLRRLEGQQRGDDGLRISAVIHEMIVPGEDGPRLTGVHVRKIGNDREPFQRDRLDGETVEDFKRRCDGLYREETGTELGWAAA